MKAEHRKELRTNALADQVGKWVEGLKGPQSTSSVVIWVIVGLAVGTAIVWFWLSRPSEVTARLWARLDNDSFNKPEEYFSEANQKQLREDLGEVAGKNRRTIPGRTARFQEARYLLPLGLKNLATSHGEAYRQLEDARRIYEEVARECSDNPVLLQEAFLGAGKAEEALTGVPSEKDEKVMRGDPAKAKEFYRKARDIKPDSYLGQVAGQHYEQLDKDSAAVVKFYQELNQRGRETRKGVKGFDLKGALQP